MRWETRSAKAVSCFGSPNDGPGAGPPQAGPRPSGAGAQRLGGPMTGPAPGRPKQGRAPRGQERSDWGAQ